MNARTHLFLALSRSGWGETAFGIQLAKEIHRRGDRCVFFANPSAAPLFSQLPFVYEEVRDHLGGLIKLFVESYIQDNDVGSIILADFNTAHGVLREMGVDARFLLKYDVPLVAVDTWSSTESGHTIDVFANKQKQIGEWLSDVPFRLLPVPIIRPQSVGGTCRFLPEATVPSRTIRAHFRDSLGLTKSDGAIMVCTAGWQHATYNDADGERIARAIPELFLRYVDALGSDVHLVHVGPTRLGENGALNGRYHWLPSVPTQHFDLLLGSMDLMVSFNISAATIGKAITSKVPVMVLQNSFDGSSADEIVPQLSAQPSKHVLQWIRDTVPLYPFRLWPLGFSRFLEPILANNVYLTAVEVGEFLEEEKFLSRCSSLLRCSSEREEVQNRQTRYVDQVSRLPAPSEVLSSYVGG